MKKSIKLFSIILFVFIINASNVTCMLFNQDNSSDHTIAKNIVIKKVTDNFYKNSKPTQKFIILKGPKKTVDLIKQSIQKSLAKTFEIRNNFIDSNQKETFPFENLLIFENYKEKMEKQEKAMRHIFQNMRYAGTPGNLLITKLRAILGYKNKRIAFLSLDSIIRAFFYAAPYYYNDLSQKAFSDEIKNPNNKKANILIIGKEKHLSSIPKNKFEIVEVEKIIKHELKKIKKFKEKLSQSVKKKHFIDVRIKTH